jgi:hypothetical protein
VSVETANSIRSASFADHVAVPGVAVSCPRA